MRIAAAVGLGSLGFDESNICEKLRLLLDSERARLRKQAALALGKLQDIESVETLIEFLDDENRGVSGNAYWALKNITGLRFPPESQRWKIWWKNESENALEKRRQLLLTLRTGSRKEMLGALRDAGKIRLGKKEVVGILVDFLEHGDPEIRKLSCLSLARLKARNALTKILPLLTEHNLEVKEAAHSALKEITGIDLPPDPDEWEKALRDI